MIIIKAQQEKKKFNILTNLTYPQEKKNLFQGTQSHPFDPKSTQICRI